VVETGGRHDALSLSDDLWIFATSHGAARRGWGTAADRAPLQALDTVERSDAVKISNDLHILARSHGGGRCSMSGDTVYFH
jgi:hypothetical protein